MTYRASLLAALAFTGLALATPGSLALADSPAPPVVAPAPVGERVEAPRSDTKRGPHALRIRTAADGLFYATARVNGQAVRFLIDTGASVVVLTSADAERLGVTPDDAAFTSGVRTASGTSAMAWTKLRHVEFAGRRMKGIAAVVSRDALSVSLLGQNLLARLGSVTLRGRYLQVGDEAG